MPTRKTIGNHWENNVFTMLRTLSATTVCCGANAAQRTATVTKKPLKNVGKTSKICKIKCLANPGSVQCTAGVGAVHGRGKPLEIIGKTTFSQCCVHFPQQLFAVAPMQPSGRQRLPKNLSKTLGKQAKSAKSNVLQIRGRCSARPARATAEATSYRRQVAYPASPHLGGEMTTHVTRVDRRVKAAQRGLGAQASSGGR